MTTLVLLRHGESEWNRQLRFTGWQDPDLTVAGEEESRRAGRVLRTHGIVPTVVHTSRLRRATRTAELCLAGLGVHVATRPTWRLNERHYGILEGRPHAEVRAEHGDRQVDLWQRTFDQRPPPMATTDERHPGHDPSYRDVDAAELPNGESVADVIDRVQAWWHGGLIPTLTEGSVLMVVSHGNTIRAIRSVLEPGIATDLMREVVPTAVPLVYELNADLTVRSFRTLG